MFDLTCKPKRCIILRYITKYWFSYLFFNYFHVQPFIILSFCWVYIFLNHICCNKLMNQYVTSSSANTSLIRLPHNFNPFNSSLLVHNKSFRPPLHRNNQLSLAHTKKNHLNQVFRPQRTWCWTFGRLTSWCSLLYPKNTHTFRFE